MDNWILCSNTVPSGDTEIFIVTCKDAYETTLGTYWCVNNESGWVDINKNNIEVIAWQPLPEPYKGETK